MFKATARTHYACIAMIDLAKNCRRETPVALHEIGDRHQVPPRFLTLIMADLKDAGLVESVRGAGGGYRLIVAPSKVTLLDVLNAVSDVVSVPDCDVVPEVVSSITNKYTDIVRRMTRQCKNITLLQLTKAC